jgi:hypothetical protein
MAGMGGAKTLDSDPFVVKRAESVPQIVTTPLGLVIRLNGRRSGGIETIHEDFPASCSVSAASAAKKQNRPN